MKETARPYTEVLFVLLTQGKYQVDKTRRNFRLGPEATSKDFRVDLKLEGSELT